MLNTSLYKFSARGIIQKNSNHLEYIDMMYLFGILLVVWGHSHPLDGSWWGSWYEQFNIFIYSFHMPLYFFLGGYLLVHSQSIDRSGYKTWAFSKLFKFLIPYFVLTVVAYFPKAMISSINDVVEINFQYFFRTTFLEPRSGVWGHFWFIPTFLTLDLFWGIWRSWSKKSTVVYYAGLFAGITISLIMKMFPIKTNILGLHDLMQESVFYVFGITVALLKPVLWDKPWKNILGILIAIPVVYISYPFGNHAINQYPVVNLMVSLLLIWICWNAAMLLSLVPMELPSKLTKYSFSIYLYSWPVQAVLDVILRKSGVNWMISIAVMFIAGITVPLLILTIYKKLRFLHCRFLDYLIGISTVTSKGVTP